MKLLNKAEIAQLQEALDTLNTPSEIYEFRSLINHLCDWCSTLRPIWGWKTNRPTVSVSRAA